MLTRSRPPWRAACVLLLGLVTAHPSLQAQSPPRTAGQDATIDRDELARLLTLLASSAERITMGGRMGRAGESLPDVIYMCRVARLMAPLPAEQRYVLLRDWVLPREPDALMRTAVCFAPADLPPEPFFTQRPFGPADAVPRLAAMAPGDDGVICFLEMLVQAAAESGHLEELDVLAQKAAVSSDAAQKLQALIAFARDRDGSLSARADDITASWLRAPDAPVPTRCKFLEGYALWRAWMRSTFYAEPAMVLADRLEDALRESNEPSLLSFLHRDRAWHHLTRSGGAYQLGDDPGLRHWIRGGYYFTGGNQAGPWPGWWVERAGIVRHVAGPEVSPLYLRYPLEGTFEFEVEAYSGNSAEAAVQFGRSLFEPFHRAGQAQLLAIGQREALEHPVPSAEAGQFHSLAIRVTPNKVSYLLRGEVVFEDDASSPTTPWLALVGRAPRSALWRNLRLTGHPQIPREVTLIDGDRMEGWMSPLYRESLPRQWGKTPAQGLAWFAEEGVLHGPPLKGARRDTAIQSWLTYHRPLEDGDRISYEFFYEPEAQLVYPTLGRVAMLHDPEGIRLHWITDVPHMAIGGLGPDNVATVERTSTITTPPPLKPQAWNMVTLDVAQNAATLRLNGVVVYRHPLAPTANRTFGLFRYKNRTAAQVRRITLAGNWPESLPAEQAADLTAHRTELTESAENQAARRALIPDAWQGR